MRAVIQRVSRAEAKVGAAAVGACGAGLLVLLGVATGDRPEDADRLALKVSRLRVFENSDGKFDRSIIESRGEVLVVSQFTLISDTTKGNRPSFADAARPDLARQLYERFCATLAAQGVPVATGVFGARMSIGLVNDGPVTIVLG
jgi:D-tyrosyl-tRNA(Tyr) deacylase